MASHRALVVGGSGFLGSAICRACVQRGWEVVSLSRNGEPAYAEHGNTSEPGKKPEWANQVEWVKGSAFDEALVKSLMPKSTAVVHTLGILLESDYKSRGVSSLASSIARGFRENRDLADDRANPLSTSYRSATPPSSSGTSGQRGGKYETINRDSALAVLRACLETPATRHPGTAPKPEPTETPFVYISAEDVFRPVIPARYIATKREAEVGIQRLAETARAMLELGREQDNEFEDLERPGRLVRPILVRPSLIYDPQVRPLSALPAALLSLSASVQARLPASLQAHTGSSIFSALTSRYSSARPDLPSASESVANLLSIPPIRVDEVAQAVVRSIEEKDIRGVVGVCDMQALLAGRGPATAGFGHHPRASHPYPQA